MYVFTRYFGTEASSADGVLITPKNSVTVGELQLQRYTVRSMIYAGVTISWTASAAFNLSDGTQLLLNRGPALTDCAIIQTSALRTFTMKAD